MKAIPIIYMADIIDSGSTLTPSVYQKFKDVVEGVNARFRSDIASPLTVTLGDEFQGIILGNGSKNRKDNIARSLHVVFEMEEQMLYAVPEISLRHVLYEGKIDVDINPEIAHGMIGEPLTNARKKLNSLKKRGNMSSRFAVSLKSEPTFSSQMERCFLLYESIADRWKKDDTELIRSFLKLNDYKLVAESLKKDISLMWRRSRSLQMREYQELKNLMESMVFLYNFEE